MLKKYDLTVKTSSYVDAQGNDKAKWLNVGVVMENDDGKQFILLNRTFNPAGTPNPDNKESVLISMFEPKQKEDF